MHATSRENVDGVRPYTILRGQVVPGRGHANGHIRNAADEISIITGAQPFPGSLNVLLDHPVKLTEESASTFDGGARLLWPATLHGEKVWLYRWRHAPLHIVEIIAHVSLRSRFDLQDGASVDLLVANQCIGLTPRWSWALLWKGREKFVYTHDRYNREVGKLARNTGFSIDPIKRVIPTSVKNVVRKYFPGAVRRPFHFSRMELTPASGQLRETQQIANLLNYTKTSNTSYSAQQFPAGYHSIELNGQKLAGQRDPAARLSLVPIQFAGLSVVDLGSNQGGMLLQLADQLKWGVGIDYDPRMVNAANRIRAVKQIQNLNFYNFDLQNEQLQIIRDFLPEQKADVCFLLSVCMWLSNWREVIDFAASISDIILFESNGTPEQQHDQIEYLRKTMADVTVLAEQSNDDPSQKLRQLVIARR